MTTRQSTPKEIEARRTEIEASICKGDTVHSDMPSWHDWRLWKRQPYYRDDGTLGWPLAGWYETWYCTRCRKIEERTVES